MSGEVKPLLNLRNKSNDSIPTPIDYVSLNQLLDGYDPVEREFLVTGFQNGFRIPFTGIRQSRLCSNLPSIVGKSEILKSKILAELQAGRVAGPFDQIPIYNIQLSPLGIVPKKAPNEYRVIHHLSFPNGESINDGIDKSYCSVHYQTIDDAVKLVKLLGKGALMSKTDIENAYRIIPIHPSDYDLLGFSIDNKFYYDKTLPFGLSSACQLFEKFSSAIHWILNTKFRCQFCVHILDDFLFLGPPKTSICQESLSSFYNLSKEVGFPIKQNKTVYPTTCITFLGLEIDSDNMVLRLPQDKLLKMKHMISVLARKKKVTLLELQSCIGLLNFACSVVTPGRTFLRRLIDLTKGLQRPYHYRNLNNEARSDLQAWSLFLDHFNGTALFIDDTLETSQTLHMYSDASNVGFGGFLGTKWFSGLFSNDWLIHHITVREFFPIVLAIEIFHDQLANRNIEFHTDNIAVVYIINKHTSKDPTLMKLMRRFMVSVLRYNIMLKAVHISGLCNKAADFFLSRSQIMDFLIYN